MHAVVRLFTGRKFRTKLLLGFTSIALLCSVGGAYGLVVQNRLSTAQASTYNDSLVPAETLQQALTSTLSSRNDVLALINNALFDNRVSAKQTLDDSKKSVTAALQTVK